MKKISSLLNNIKHFLTKSPNNITEDSSVNIMSEEFTTGSPVVSMEILFKVPKKSLISSSNKLTPSLCCSYIYDFEVEDSLDEYFTDIKNPCGNDLPKITGTYYLDNKYISCSVSYNASLLQDGNVVALEEGFYTILPFLYCGGKYIVNPTEDDFIVNLSTSQNPVSPVGETEEYYLYQITVESSISLITIVIVDEEDTITLSQLNYALGKPADNNFFTFAELSQITDLTYDSVNLDDTDFYSNSVGVSPIDLGVFRYLPNLRNLTMARCNLHSILPQILALSSLENLNLDGNHLSNLSVFENRDISISANNQVIHIDMVDVNPASDKYELNLGFLRNPHNVVPDVTSTSANVSGGIISWPLSDGGKNVEFQFSDNDNFSGSVSVFLKDYSNPSYDISNSGVITKYHLVNPSVTDLNIPMYINGIKVRAIGYKAFGHCYNLRSISIPNSVSSIDNWAFSYCSSLLSISIPNSVSSIGQCAFYYCSSLPSISIPNSVTSIGNGAFNSCYRLVSISIPNSVTSIGYSSFQYCSSLLSISIPNSITSIGNQSFSYCSGLVSISIPNSITSIGDDAFLSCYNLPSINIPNSVTSIGKYAFYHCSSLRSISIPNSVTFIGYNTFDYCSSLNSLTIPYTLCIDKKYYFYDCKNITTLKITATSDVINPNQEKSQLLAIWNTCVNNLQLYLPNISGKFLIIDNQEIDLDK